MRKVYNALKKHFWPGTLVCPSIVKIWLEYLHSTGVSLTSNSGSHNQMPAKAQSKMQNY